jgi:hypothetical protein
VRSSCYLNVLSSKVIVNLVAVAYKRVVIVNHGPDCDANIRCLIFHASVIVTFIVINKLLRYNNLD